ncbi:hypothetical protein B0H11DRAFT_673057 [Mycena galericulata]|nr:hypothetical protein B0H11DRAFT_673057 [Mycena galericulata]
MGEGATFDYTTSPPAAARPTPPPAPLSTHAMRPPQHHSYARNGNETALSRGSLRHGRVEVRAKMPQGDWLWPACSLSPPPTPLARERRDRRRRVGGGARCVTCVAGGRVIISPMHPNSAMGRVGPRALPDRGVVCVDSSAGAGADDGGGRSSGGGDVLVAPARRLVNTSRWRCASAITLESFVSLIIACSAFCVRTFCVPMVWCR